MTHVKSRGQCYCFIFNQFNFILQVVDADGNWSSLRNYGDAYEVSTVDHISNIILSQTGSYNILVPSHVSSEMPWMDLKLKKMYGKENREVWISRDMLDSGL